MSNILKVFGAGMAGLLTARILQARGKTVHVYEVQEKLPDNHGALLRFRSSAVADATGIPFRKVTVQKALWDGKRLVLTPSLLHNNQYSLKVLGRVASRSILSLEPVERYIAPPDFLKRLAAGVTVLYGAALAAPEPGISTIPMPALATILGVTIPASFEAKKIWTRTLYIEKPGVDVYQTVYFPEASSPLYRASLTGNRLTLEYADNPKHEPMTELQILWNAFGIMADQVTTEAVRSQRYGKILPIDDEARRAFLLYATEKHRIYSVGRFATWRQILLDDVVNDVNVVERLMSQVDRYGLIKEISRS